MINKNIFININEKKNILINYIFAKLRIIFSIKLLIIIPIKTELNVFKEIIINNYLRT